MSPPQTTSAGLDGNHHPPESHTGARVSSNVQRRESRAHTDHPGELSTLPGIAADNDAHGCAAVYPVAYGFLPTQPHRQSHLLGVRQIDHPETPIMSIVGTRPRDFLDSSRDRMPYSADGEFSPSTLLRPRARHLNQQYSIPAYGARHFAARHLAHRRSTRAIHTLPWPCHTATTARGQSTPASQETLPVRSFCP